MYTLIEPTSTCCCSTISRMCSRIRSSRPLARQDFRKPRCTRGRVPSHELPRIGGCGTGHACDASRHVLEWLILSAIDTVNEVHRGTPRLRLLNGTRQDPRLESRAGLADSFPRAHVTRHANAANIDMNPSAGLGL